MTDKAIALRPDAAATTTSTPNALDFNREQIELIKTQIAVGCTDLELRLFMEIAKRRGLDPFAKQIYAVKRWNKKTQREEMTAQTSIDGLRLIADRTGRYTGQTKPEWCGDDGVWKEVWISKAKPAAARIGVFKANCTESFYGVAHFCEYEADTHFWRGMPRNQIMKCAEALALRKAFPEEMSGIYTDAEMDRADAQRPPRTTAAAPSPAATVAPPEHRDATPPPADEPKSEMVVQLEASIEAQARAKALAGEITALGKRLDEIVGPEQAKRMREAVGVVGVAKMTPAQKMSARDQLRVLVEGAEADAALGAREPTPDDAGDVPWAPKTDAAGEVAAVEE